MGRTEDSVSFIYKKKLELYSLLTFQVWKISSSRRNDDEVERRRTTSNTAVVIVVAFFVRSDVMVRKRGMMMRRKKDKRQKQNSIPFHLFCFALLMFMPERSCTYITQRENVCVCLWVTHTNKTSSLSLSLFSHFTYSTQCRKKRERKDTGNHATNYVYKFFSFYSLVYMLIISHSTHGLYVSQTNTKKRRGITETFQNNLSCLLSFFNSVQNLNQTIILDG